MAKSFSIYENPISAETQILRRNSLLASSLCLFISLTKELPKSFAFFDVNFDASQQLNVGWFLFLVTLYLYLHFVANAGIELASWLEPLYSWVYAREELLKHPAFEREDFMDIPLPVDEFNLQDVQAEAAVVGKDNAKKRLRHLYRLVYLKITLEIIIPLLIGLWGLVGLACLHNNPLDTGASKINML